MLNMLNAENGSESVKTPRIFFTVYCSLFFLDIFLIFFIYIYSFPKHSISFSLLCASKLNTQLDITDTLKISLKACMKQHRYVQRCIQ